MTILLVVNLFDLTGNGIRTVFVVGQSKVEKVPCMVLMECNLVEDDEFGLQIRQSSVDPIFEIF